jgi:hypothetical protein
VTTCQGIKLRFFSSRSKWRHGTLALLWALVSRLICHDDTDSDSREHSHNHCPY